jgi:broad specificity polyphosphatase/5'/3'-nucleotidase SurE
MSKPLILVSNDDGITSKGIRVLVSVMKKIGDVVVVAPDSPQSGMGHAITIGETLRLYEEDIVERPHSGFGGQWDQPWFQHLHFCLVLRDYVSRDRRGT